MMDQERDSMILLSTLHREATIKPMRTRTDISGMESTVMPQLKEDLYTKTVSLFMTVTT